MNANELPTRIAPHGDNEYMNVGVRFVDNNWGAEAEWNAYEQVIKVVYHHDNAHGERVFSVIGEDVPGFCEWVCESDIMFIRDSDIDAGKPAVR